MLIAGVCYSTMRLVAALALIAFAFAAASTESVVLTDNAHSQWGDAPRTSGVVRMRYVTDSSAAETDDTLRRHMEAAGCFVSRKVALDVNGRGGLVAGASIVLGEVLASCPVDLLLSHARAAGNALSQRCESTPHCCIPLQVLDVLGGVPMTSPSGGSGGGPAYTLARHHFRLLPESGAHVLPTYEPALECFQSDVASWRVASQRAVDIT